MKHFISFFEHFFKVQGKSKNKIIWITLPQFQKVVK